MSVLLCEMGMDDATKWFLTGYQDKEGDPGLKADPGCVLGRP